MRNKDGSLYKKTTLTTYRHAIQRHLAAVRDDVNIIHGDDFKNSKTLFVAQTRKMKEEGMAKIDHHPAVEPSVIAKLYDYVCADLEAAKLLQKKVSLFISIC